MSIACIESVLSESSFLAIAPDVPVSAQLSVSKELTNFPTFSERLRSDVASGSGFIGPYRDGEIQDDPLIERPDRMFAAISQGVHARRVSPLGAGSGDVLLSQAPLEDDSPFDLIFHAERLCDSERHAFAWAWDHDGSPAVDRGLTAATQSYVSQHGLSSMTVHAVNGNGGVRDLTVDLTRTMDCIVC